VAASAVNRNIFLASLATEISVFCLFRSTRLSHRRRNSVAVVLWKLMSSRDDWRLSPDGRHDFTIELPTS